MSGFRSKVGDFLSQYDVKCPSPEDYALKRITAEYYLEFFSRTGGPHKLEGLLYNPQDENDFEYINVRRSAPNAGQLIIEPITINNQHQVVTEDPQQIHAYRCKISSGTFDQQTGKWEYEFTKVLNIIPGFEIDKVHHQLDLALRIKYSLAERFLKGEDVSNLIAMYSSEQPFYRGGFGKIIESDPLREPYLRDAIIAEIERIVETKDYSELKESKDTSDRDSKKITYELRPGNFMQAKVKSGSIRLQKVGTHYLAVFSEKPKESGTKDPAIENRFELHGGRAENLFSKLHTQILDSGEFDTSEPRRKVTWMR